MAGAISGDNAQRSTLNVQHPTSNSEVVKLTLRCCLVFVSRVKVAATSRRTERQNYSQNLQASGACASLEEPFT
jgi:hypothetical protein